jgi:leucyl/phenylalanyl-tRNA---protein transferase
VDNALPDPPLTTDLLLRAYSRGYFPMAEGRGGRVSWYSPDPRAVIPIETFHLSRSLRQLIRKGVFEIRIDEAFGEVIRACAEREETWISEEILAAYSELHRQGHAHSVETRRDGRLVGGLYGVVIGGAFFGESMFSREPNASKVALAALIGRLRERGFLLLDTQFMNEHLRQFGTVEIPRDEYLHRLARAMRVRASFHG